MANFVVKKCQKKNGYRIKIEGAGFEDVENKIKGLDLFSVRTSYLDIFKYDGKRISILKNGDLIVWDCDKEEAEKIAKHLFG